MSHDEELEASTRAAIAKIEEAVSQGEMVIFKPSEAEALREVASWWLALKSTGKVGAVIYSALKWMVGFIVLLAAIRSGFFEWIATGLNQIGGSK